MAWENRWNIQMGAVSAVFRFGRFRHWPSPACWCQFLCPSCGLWPDNQLKTQGLKNPPAASTLCRTCFCHVPGLPSHSRFHLRLLPNGVSMPAPLVSIWPLSKINPGLEKHPCSFHSWPQPRAWKTPLQLPLLASTQGLKNTPAASTLGHSSFCHVPGLHVD